MSSPANPATPAARSSIAAADATSASDPAAARKASRTVYRHRVPVRLMHWVNVVCLTILLMSGLTIFNAHPALYWGQASTFDDPWLSIGAVDAPDGGIRGVTTLGSHQFSTDGVLGASRVGNETQKTVRAFPSWSTLPSPQWLALGRNWHLAFAWLFVANGIAYVLYAIFSGHLTRDLLPTRPEWAGIGQAVKDHILFRHPTGENAKRYNVLQNLAYLVVIFGLFPLLILAGFGMSPRLDAVFPGWVSLFGGRQSARSLHFLATFGLLLFTFVHVFEVLISGVWNQMRSMVTGWYTLPAAKGDKS